MAVIKPVRFPHIQRPPVQNNLRPVRAKNIKPASRQIAAQPVNIRPQTNIKAKLASGVKSTKDEKLEVAIEVLRQKTVQFYGPKKNEVKQTTALGTFIDIKA